MPRGQRRAAESQQADRGVMSKVGELESRPCLSLRTCLSRQRSSEEV
jgi:hypothetical protein